MPLFPVPYFLDGDPDSDNGLPDLLQCGEPQIHVTLWALGACESPLLIVCVNPALLLLLHKPARLGSLNRSKPGNFNTFFSGDRRG